MVLGFTAFDIVDIVGIFKIDFCLTKNHSHAISSVSLWIAEGSKLFYQVYLI